MDMYEARQNKEKVSRRIDGGRARQNRKKHSISNVTEFFSKRSEVIQKRNARKEPNDSDPRFLRYDIEPLSDGRANLVKDVKVFDNRDPFDGGDPSTNVVGFDNLISGLWVRFHILNRFLGGPGDNTGNLIPTRQSDNKSSYWSNIEEDMKKIASKRPGLAFNAQIDYHPNSVYPSRLVGNYGPIGEYSNPINISFNPPQSSDFKRSKSVSQAVNLLSRYGKNDRERIITKWMQMGFLLPDSEYYAKQRFYRTLDLRRMYNQRQLLSVPADL